MTNRTMADRVNSAINTGKEATFYGTDDVLGTGTEYPFTGAGIHSYILAQNAATNLIPLAGQTAAFTFTVPAGYYIEAVIITNNTANAITGGLKFGSTLAGTDVVTAQAVGASAIIHVLDATLTKRRFAKASAQIIYVDTVTSWNSANIDMDVVLRKYL